VIGVQQLVQNKATIGLDYAAGAAAWLVFASIVKTVQAFDIDRDVTAKRDFDGLKAAMFEVRASVT
jgi:hypothetical protein